MKFLLKFIWIFLLPIAVLLTHVAARSSALVEKIYSSAIYPVIGQSLSSLTGFIPLSLAEIIVVILFLFLLWKIPMMLFQLIRQSSNQTKVLTSSFLKLLNILSFLYIVFLLVWGLNYHRLPFADIANLEVRPAAVKELEALCVLLIQQTNDLRDLVEENPQGHFMIPQKNATIFQRAAAGYQEASVLYPQLGGHYGSAKGVLLSEWMSYTGISGIYFPFTGEANVNQALPDSLLPSTAAHEMAHQRGFAREDEANYISYLVCSLHPDVDFQYSGTLLALIHVMNQLYVHDPTRYKELRASYHPGIFRDLQEITAFNQRYEGPIEKAQSKLNDAYLKSNMQKDGIHSYGRMVDLLIAEFHKKGKL